MEKNLFQTSQGLKISLGGEVKKENIVMMVDNCKSGKCECMSDETKQKLRSIEVSGEDGAVDIDLEGDITAEEIAAAMAKSPILGQN